MKIHPLAQIIPPLTADEIERLEESISRGYDPMKPIVLHEDMILDGRHRQQIAEKAGEKPTYVDWKPAYAGDTPAAFVARSIIHRSLTATQRATIAAELLPHIEEEAQKRIKAGKADPEKKVSQGRAEQSAAVAAKATGANQQYVKQAKVIKEKSPATFEKMKSGEIGMAEAKAVVKAPPRPVKTSPADAALATAPVFKELRNRAHALKRDVEALCQKPEGAELSKVWKRIEAALESVATDIRYKTPFKPCPIGPTCEVGCKQCKGKKWLSEDVYEALPEAMKS